MNRSETTTEDLAAKLDTLRGIVLGQNEALLSQSEILQFILNYLVDASDSSKESND